MSERKLKVLMFGWEFPPFNSGGLGTACHGLTKALADKNVSVTFVLPKKVNVGSTLFDIKFADEFLPNLSVKGINSLLRPYITSADYKKMRNAIGENFYGSSLLEEVKLYALRARELAETMDFDVIHAHDWLSFGAGLAAKEASGKPLVVHIHATEFDRTGGTGVNPEVYQMEKIGMEEADKVVAISNFTKKIVVDRYGIIPTKVVVVHNGIEFEKPDDHEKPKVSRFEKMRKAGKKIVLFVGRLTLQKGPDYFIRAAKRVLDYYPNVYFVIAGSGDMEHQVIREAASLGISDKVIFAGFLRGQELDDIYRNSDLFVMPSVSEPFGLTALEAIRHGTPVIMSKQSGVSEVIRSAIKVDFWDVDEMANKIVCALYHQSLRETIKLNAWYELPNVSWRKAAEKCVEIYKQLVHPLAYEN